MNAAYDDGGKYVKSIRRHDDCYGLVVKQQIATVLHTNYPLMAVAETDRD